MSLYVSSSSYQTVSESAIKRYGSRASFGAMGPISVLLSISYLPFTSPLRVGVYIKLAQKKLKKIYYT